MIKNFLFVSIFTFVIVLSWIIFSVYHTYTTSQITPDAAIAITPIPPQFDQDMINVIKSKKKIEVDLGAERTSKDGISVETPVSSESAQSPQPVDQTQAESQTPTPTAGVGL